MPGIKAKSGADTLYASRWAGLLRLLNPGRATQPHASDETGICRVGAMRIPYHIKRSARRRRSLAMTVKADQSLGASIHIAAPIRTHRAVIEAFIQNRNAWILRRLEETRAAAPMPPDFVDGASMAYLGYACRLHITQDRSVPAACRLAPGRLLINISADQLTGEHLRQEVRLEILLWLKKRAKVKLQRRLDFWAQRLGIRYQKMVISNPGQRWGSCSARDVIRLNWRLIMAPLPLLDYVVAHELCHVAHKNHGAGFWRLLGTVMPDYPARRRALRRFERGMVL